jgi:AcrR family transcriptional regulator
MPHDNKDEKNRAEIREAARKVFQRWGIQKTSMEDIAKAAGKGKSTLYYYFKNKDEVIMDVAREEINAMFNIATLAAQRATSAKEKLQTYISVRSEEIQRKVLVYEAVRGELKNTDLVYRIRKLVEDQEAQLLRDILEYGIRQGELKSINENDAGEFTYIIASAIHGMEIDQVMGKDQMHHSDRSAYAAELMINGLMKK